MNGLSKVFHISVVTARRYEGRLSELFCVVLCTEVVQS